MIISTLACPFYNLKIGHFIFFRPSKIKLKKQAYDYPLFFFTFLDPFPKFCTGNPGWMGGENGNKAN